MNSATFQVFQNHLPSTGRTTIMQLMEKKKRNGQRPNCGKKVQNELKTLKRHYKVKWISIVET